MSAVLQLGGAIAIVLGLAGTWLAARSHAGWLVCIASSALWLPTLVSAGQWVAVFNVALSIAICLRNFLTRRARSDQGQRYRTTANGHWSASQAPTVSASSPSRSAHDARTQERTWASTPGSSHG